jgi:hypothetical protein
MLSTLRLKAERVEEQETLMVRTGEKNRATGNRNVKLEIPTLKSRYLFLNLIL